MNLDEAIEHAEEVAELNQAIAYNSDDDNWMDIAQCEKCAEEHRQLAEWLRELKCLRGQKPCEDCISREQALKYSHIEYDDDGEGHRVIYTEDIEELPSVTPYQGVIRCKDCKHWTNNIGDSEIFRDNYCNEKAHGNFYRCSGDDYCSFAERRTDE